MLYIFYLIAGLGAGVVTCLAMVCGCGIGWVCGFTGSGGGILMLTVFTLLLQYNLKIAVGTSTMIMTLVALTGTISHVTMGATIYPLPMFLTVAGFLPIWCGCFFAVCESV